MKEHEKRMVQTKQGFEHRHLKPEGCLPSGQSGTGISSLRAACQVDSQAQKGVMGLLYSMLYSII